MKQLFGILFFVFAVAFLVKQVIPLTQNSEESRPSFRADRNGPPPGERPGRPFGGPGGGGPRGFRGGPGGPPVGVQEPITLVEQFDNNGDKWLNAEERKAAREYVEKEKAEGRLRGPGFRGGPENSEQPGRGPKIAPSDTKNFPDAEFYDADVLRTVFLEFDSPDWEKELLDFWHTDVDVPAKLTVDGKNYSDVGVHFRGASSFFTVGPGRKHSINLTTDFIQKDQNLYGYRSLNLLNSHTDPTFLRSVLYLQAARDYIPAPKANYVRVAINGESWGAYINAQQFNKEFVKEWFGTTEGARWKVPGSPRAKGGLEYLGEKAGAYRKIYDIKSKDDKKSWRALINLCRVLNETPPETLVQELSPLLDIDGALKFLALENALINSDGYWIRTSDYNLYCDPKGQFHVIPHDANETFREPEGPGWRSESAGAELDPLTGAGDPTKPLLNKLLAVPSLRTKYLGYVRDIAEKWLDWKKIGPLAEKYQSLIAADVKTDSHKLYSNDAFAKAVTQDIEEQGFRGPHQTASLKNFVEKRRSFLLNHPAVRDLPNSKL